LLLNLVQRRLQVQKVLVGAQLRVVFDGDHQAAQCARQRGFHLHAFPLRQVRVHRAAAQFGDAFQQPALVFHVLLDRRHKVRNQVVSLL
jgi:hypothetical protein